MVSASGAGALLAAAAALWALTGHTVLAGINAVVAAVFVSVVVGLEILGAPRRALLFAGITAVLAVGLNGALALAARDSGQSPLLPPAEVSAQRKAVSAEQEPYRKLAERFAPILKLNSGEPFFPLGRDLFVAASDLRQASASEDEPIPFTRLEKSLPSAARCVTPCRYYLDLDGARPPQGGHRYERIQAQLLGSRPRLTVYWHARPYPEGVTLQYWFLYLFNDFKNKHESDWEHVTVYVLLDGGKAAAEPDPDTVYLSAHEGGHKRPWKAVETFEGRPVVYVGRGSHANYFEAGSIRIRPCEQRPCGLAKVTDRFDGCGPTLAPEGEKSSTAELVRSCHPTPATGTYRPTPLLPPRFIGDYARGNYVWQVEVPKATYPDPQLRRDQWNDPLVELANATVDSLFVATQ